MHPTDLRPESVLPHRERMLLVDKVLELNEQGAVTRSVVSESWPLFRDGGVEALVLVELVAQTAGIHNGWIRDRIHGPDADKRGWIVGIRQANFSAARIPLLTELTVRTENRMAFEGFRDIFGTVTAGSATVAEITLQLLRSEPTA